MKVTKTTKLKTALTLEEVNATLLQCLGEGKVPRDARVVEMSDAFEVGYDTGRVKFFGQITLEWEVEE